WLSDLAGKDIEKTRVFSIECALECGGPRSEVGFTYKGRNEL
ncbi:hypothetical protein PENVUL_c069G03579, partial [Penicillium vulpinum]